MVNKVSLNRKCCYCGEIMKYNAQQLVCPFCKHVFVDVVIRNAKQVEELDKLEELRFDFFENQEKYLKC